MKKVNFILILFSTLVLQAHLTSCKNTTENVTPQPEKLMTINFTKGYVPNDLEVIVFISDSAGNLISEIVCPADGAYEIFAPAGMKAPDNMMVTIVRYDLYWHNLLIQINTYLNISPTEWTIAGNQPVSLGDAVIKLVNVPTTAKAKVYSAFGYSNYTFSVNPQTCPVNSNPDDFYVKLNTAPDEPKYKWLKGIEAGGNYEMDLSDMQNAYSKVIQFPIIANFFKAKLWGINNNDLTLALMTDMVIGDGNPAEQVSLSYPAENFGNYRTHLFLQKSFQEKTAYMYNVVGDIPSAFTPTNAEIIFIEPSPNSINYGTSGQFDVTKAAWYYLSSNNEVFNWYVFAPPSETSVNLPSLPPLFISTFPFMQTDSMQYNNIELIDFQNLDSYNNVFQEIFNPANPKDPDQLTSSSVMEIPLHN